MTPMEKVKQVQNGKTISTKKEKKKQKIQQTAAKGCKNNSSKINLQMFNM